jgi:hypothetical protein
MLGVGDYIKDFKRFHGLVIKIGFHVEVIFFVWLGFYLKKLKLNIYIFKFKGFHLKK